MNLLMNLLVLLSVNAQDGNGNRCVGPVPTEGNDCEDTRSSFYAYMHLFLYIYIFIYTYISPLYIGIYYTISGSA